MAPRKAGRTLGWSDAGNKQDDMNELSKMKTASGIASVIYSLSTLPDTDLRNADQARVKIESESDEEVVAVPSLNEGNPDSFWIVEWKKSDLKTAIESQVQFFNTCPTFDNSISAYVDFFEAIRKTVLEAEAAQSTIATDPVAKANLKSLCLYFDAFTDKCIWLLRDNLEGILLWDYSQCQNFDDLEYVLRNHDGFLKSTENMASVLGLEKEWDGVSTHMRVVKKVVAIAKQGGLFDTVIPSMQDSQPAKSVRYVDGPISPDLLKLDYEFTDIIWSQWVEGCISYFEYWTADSTWTLPAEDFLRHLSHLQLAMKLFLRQKSIPDNKLSTLHYLAKLYMRQYGNFTASTLESKYAILKENINKTGLYLTEARFWLLADDIEVLTNEVPQGIEPEAWVNAVPSMLSQEKVLAARDAIKTLYQEFQIQRYPEDEVSYLWSLTWRNIKHLLPYLTSPVDLAAIQQDFEGVPITIEARDLALPFVEKNLSQILTIVRKDHDALYQKEIEALVGEYCAHIDRYVQGKGEGQERVYKQFARLSITKAVPFVCLVNLEETLLKYEARPKNDSQVIAHRVVMRLNHIMEGPKEFNRWTITSTGSIDTYSPTMAWVEEQKSLRQSGFNLDHVEKVSSSPAHVSGPTAAGNGAGGGDDGDGGDKKRPSSAGTMEDSDSDEEVEVVSPGGTKRKEKHKKAKRSRLSITPETLTKAKLKEIDELSKGPRSDSDGNGSDSQAHDSDVAEVVRISGLHTMPSDSLDYHRRRLTALKVEQYSAVPNALYPLPETAAPQRAAALQIARELADPGILTEGPRPEDVQNYINPALRLPLTEENIGKAQQAQNTEPGLIRRALSKLRDALGSPFFGSSPRHSSPRATPQVPESNAQRARREREAREATPSVLKRQADHYAVRKSSNQGGRARLPAHKDRSIDGSGDGASGDDPDLPWSDHNQVKLVSASDASSRHSDRTDQENQGPSTTSARNSNQENKPPGTYFTPENPIDGRSTQQAEGNADDWNSPSPPREQDNTIYRRSPIRRQSTPTPVKGNNIHSSGSKLPLLLPTGGQGSSSSSNGENLNASPPGPPPSDGGPEAQVTALRNWVRMEMVSNNHHMRHAYRIFQDVLRDQPLETRNFLFEMLRVGAEMSTRGSYIFERDITFGDEAHPQVRRGVPNTARAPRTPEAQTDIFVPGWWNDPNEGTREGINRPGVAWAHPLREEGQQENQNSTNDLKPKPRPGSHESTNSSRSTSSHHSATSPTRLLDDNAVVARWDSDAENRDPNDHIPQSPIVSPSSLRTWSWHSNPNTGLPQREFNIFINPDNRPRTGALDLGEPLLVHDPLNPGQLILNPWFSPEILRLVSAAGTDDHGQINVRVPPGWRVSIGPSHDRSAAPSSPSDFRSSQDTEVVIQGPGFVIHEDTPSADGSVRGRSNAPPALGLIDRPPVQHDLDSDVAETVEHDVSERGSETRSTRQQERGSSHTYSSQQDRRKGGGGGSNNSRSFQHGSNTESSNGSGDGGEGSSAAISGNAAGNTNGTNPPKSSSPPSSSTHSPTPKHPKTPKPKQPLRSKATSKSQSQSPTPNPNAEAASATTPPAQQQTSPPPPPPAAPPTPEQPWYLTWPTSTVRLLRTELSRRGIPLTGLVRKQAMINRLRQDDAENGIGGVWSPEQEEDDDGGNGEERRAGAGAGVEAVIPSPARATPLAPDAGRALKRKRKTGRVSPFWLLLEDGVVEEEEGEGEGDGAGEDGGMRTVKRRAILGG